MVVSVIWGAIFCKFIDQTNIVCGCSPDSLWGKPQLELEKNTVNKDETINFALYGMQHCVGKVEIGQLYSDIDFLQPLKGLEDGGCTFNERGTCCEGKVKITNDKNFNVLGRVLKIPEMAIISSTDYQALEVIGQVGTTIPSSSTTTSTTQLSTSTTISTCSQYTDCSSCTGVSSCGWCKDLNQCKSGSGSTDSSCSSSNWAWYSNQCQSGGGQCCCCTEFGCEWVSQSYYCSYQCSDASNCAGSSTTIQPLATNCNKENDKSWVCTSTGNLGCTQDIFGNSQSPWTCTSS
jgi:hypothetical protein